jgi:hypothetical protein
MHQARPFRPFRIHIADGRHLDVAHCEFLAHTPSGRTVIVTKEDETFEVIDLLLVTSLELINGMAKPSRDRE